MTRGCWACQRGSPSSARGRQEGGTMSNNLVKRFWANVDRSKGIKECWPWIGYRWRGGYGRFKFKGDTFIATHISLSLSGRPSTKIRTLALHACDHPWCVNPKHLRWGTPHDNNMDCKKRKGRKRWPTSKLPIFQRHQICDLYAKGNLTQTDLAIKFQVSQCYISKIVHGWKPKYPNGYGNMGLYFFIN